jgi:hypothetical protein
MTQEQINLKVADIVKNGSMFEATALVKQIADDHFFTELNACKKFNNVDEFKALQAKCSKVYEVEAPQFKHDLCIALFGNTRFAKTRMYHALVGKQYSYPDGHRPICEGYTPYAYLAGYKR